MKKGIHPKMHKNAKVTDLATGTTFTLASTKEEITVEVTNLSHPFYTGKTRVVDTENLVKKFTERTSNVKLDAIKHKKSKRMERAKKTSAVGTTSRLTLKDLMQNMK